MPFLTDFAGHLGALRDLAKVVVLPDQSSGFDTGFDTESKNAQMSLFEAVEKFLTSCNRHPESYRILKARHRQVLAWAQLNDTAPARVPGQSVNGVFFEWVKGGLEYRLKLADIGDDVLNLLLIDDEAEHAIQVPRDLRIKLRKFEMSSYFRPQSPPVRV